MLPIHFREAVESDIPFIFSTWMKQAREMGRANESFAKVSSSIFSAHYHEMIRKLLIKSNSLVASNPSDHQQVYGYIIYETKPPKSIVHMTYVKFTFRKMGIAKELWKRTLDQTNVVYHTADSYIFKKYKKDKMIFNPFLMFNDIMEYRD